MEERLGKHRQLLVDRLDPDFGLLDKLLANKILTREILHQIKLRDNTTEDRNRKLLDYIRKTTKAKEFVAALRDSGQTHLANYISADGVYQRSFEDDWPLSESDTSQLDFNRESLVDLLDTTEICSKLFAEGVINNRQKQFICSKSTDAEKNEAMLDILIKCSRRQYKSTIACLNDYNQSHVAELLSNGGGVAVRVHANIEGVVGNVDELEDEIISHLTKVLENRPLEEATRLLELTQLRIIAARKGNSIVIYIHCTTSNELQELIDLLKTNRLKEIVEMLFIELLTIGYALRITLTWALKELESAARYLELEYPYDLPIDGASHSKAEEAERSTKLSSVGDLVQTRFSKKKRSLAENPQVKKGCPPGSGEALELRQELTAARASLDTVTKENESLARELKTSKTTIEDLRNQLTQLRQQCIVLERRLILGSDDGYLGGDRKSKRTVSNKSPISGVLVKGSRQEATDLRLKLDEEEGKNTALQEKVLRLIKRNHELVVRLYLPPEEGQSEENQDCGSAQTSNNEDLVVLQEERQRDKIKIAELERELHNERRKCVGLEEARREYQEELEEQLPQIKLAEKSLDVGLL